MAESCDRCGPSFLAAYRAAKETSELYFCLPCTSRLWRALSSEGWAISPADILAVAPQAVTERGENAA